MYYVYILRCRDNTLYTGITNDLTRRLEMHGRGKASRYTRSRLPVQLIYQELCGSKSAALRREHEIKKWNKRKKEQLVSGQVRLGGDSSVPVT